MWIIVHNMIDYFSNMFLSLNYNSNYIISREEFNWSRLSNAIDQLQFKSIVAKNDLWDKQTAGKHIATLPFTWSHQYALQLIAKRVGMSDIRRATERKTQNDLRNW